ncbi:hypothetical protein BDR26DRAFT_937417 [Obelidium mucronatum]|nr:hypothetical protein BDR26DRAFT_937417 [Obelidium mucronatum]
MRLNTASRSAFIALSIATWASSRFAFVSKRSAAKALKLRSCASQAASAASDSLCAACSAAVVCGGLRRCVRKAGRHLNCLRQPSPAATPPPPQRSPPHCAAATRPRSGPLLLRAVATRSAAVVAALLAGGAAAPAATQDDESRFSALHRALYDGSLRIALCILRACPDFDVSVRDAEGNTCFDLLDVHGSDNASDGSDSDEELKDSSTTNTTNRIYSTSVWTWGSNSNMQLGHTNSNDRSFPERVDFSPHLFLDYPVSFGCLLDDFVHGFETLCLDKFHLVVLDDSRLYSCGFGLGGRLGLNSEEATLIPSIVHGLTDHFIAFVATGPDHTCAITKEGQVFTWGSNKYGQLGYKTGDPPHVLVPTEVAGPLKRIKIIGAAASKYHTVVFSNSGMIFTWGWNVGQLVAATNNATAILFATGDVQVLANHEVKRVTFVSPPLVGLGFGSIKEARNTSAFISKIVSGNHQFAALSKDGDIFLWSPPVTVEEFKNTWQQLNFPQTKPKRIWTSRKSNMVAKDVAIGIDSTILVATSSGHVFSGIRRKEVKTKESKLSKDIVYFKFTQVPYLHNIRKVFASISGAFAAIRFDELPPPITESPPTLRQDLKRVLQNDCDQADTGVDCILDSEGVPFDIDAASVSFKPHPDSPTNTSIIHVAFKNPSHPKAFSSILELIYKGGFSPDWDSGERVGGGTKQDTNPHSYLKIQSEFFALARLFELDNTSAISGTPLERFQHSFAECRRDSLLLSAAPTDVALDLCDGRLMCHQAFLVSRSPFFTAMFNNASQWMLKREETTPGHTIVVVDLNNFTVEVMDIVLDWIYTDLGLEYLLRNNNRPTLSEYLGFLIDLLSAANELLLDRLKEQVSGLLARVVDLTNVVELLEVADSYDAGQLKETCLTFLCWNLSSVLESRMLDSAPEYLIADLEATLQRMQAEKLPLLRGPNGYYARIQALAAAEEAERELYRTSVVAREAQAAESASILASRLHLNEMRAKHRLELAAKEAAQEAAAAKKPGLNERGNGLESRIESKGLLETAPTLHSRKAKKSTTWTKFEDAVSPAKSGSSKSL